MHLNGVGWLCGLPVQLVRSPPKRKIGGRKTENFFDVSTARSTGSSTHIWDTAVTVRQEHRDFDESDEEEVLYATFQALIGRLFVPVGFDNWQFWPFLKGEGDTGKSTVLDIVRAMFPVGEDASYDSRRQQIFSLEDIYDKRLLLFPDIPSRLDLVLPEDKMCSMVSGESLSIARKNKTALNIGIV